jgi:heme/copper-type cytochrome/quinol oxidase subunit 1
VPLQIGAADVAFPRLNALGFWLFLFGGLVVVTGWLISGDALQFGWVAYPPLSLDTYSRGMGADPWQANSLEWATTSPHPTHNFHELPEIHSERPVYDRRRGLGHPETAGHTDPQTKPHRG